MSSVESHIEEGLARELGPDFDMEAFMDALPEYVASMKEDSAITGRSPGTQEPFDTSTSHSASLARLERNMGSVQKNGRRGITCFSAE